MQRKSLFLVILLLSLQTSFLSAVYHHNFIKLENKALVFLDGKYPGVNADALIDCLQARALINKLLRGKKDRNTNTFLKTYDFKGQKVALDDLIEIEQKNSINSNHTDWQAFDECLSSMKEEFIEFTGPLLGEAEIARQKTIHLVREWCEKSVRPDSLLLNWGELNEREELKKATATKFGQFCIDLRNFLHDLMYNCPKGREQFKRERISMIALKEAFTQLTQQPGKVFEDAFDSLAKEYIETVDEDNRFGSVKQQFNRRKKQKFVKETDELIEAVYTALDRVAPSLSKEAFKEHFNERYQNKCKLFDSTFIPHE